MATRTTGRPSTESKRPCLNHRTLNSHLSHIGSTVSTTPFTITNTTPSYNARRRRTPLSRRLRTRAKRKWCSSAWPTKAGWIHSSPLSSSCSHLAPKPESVANARKEHSSIKKKQGQAMSPAVQPPPLFKSLRSEDDF